MKITKTKKNRPWKRTSNLILTLNKFEKEEKKEAGVPVPTHVLKPDQSSDIN